MAEMCMEGALSGELEARALLIRLARKTNDKRTEDFERKRDGGNILITKFVGRYILGYAYGEGLQWATQIETDCRTVLRNALAAKAGKMPLPQRDVTRELRAAILNHIDYGVARMARRMAPKKVKEIRAKSLSSWRSQQTGRRWKRELGVIAKRRKEGTSRPTLKREAITRMRTGWNRWYNNRTVARVQANPEVIYLQFVLGSAANHTERCLARQGMVRPKSDPIWAHNTPPLHHNCRSRLVPITRAAAKKWKIKRYTPPGYRDEPPDTGFGNYQGEPKRRRR